MSELNLREAADKLLRRNIDLREDEKVTVVTDRESCPVFNAVTQAVKSTGSELEEIKITKDRSHSSPLPELEDRFNRSDVLIGITDKSISHCPETRLARKKHGTRVISMVEVDKNLFLKAMEADQSGIKRINKKLSQKLKRSDKVKILTSSGTDLKVDVVKDAISSDDGDSTSRGDLNNLPYGEVAMAPISSANGTIAIDFSRIDVNPGDRVKLSLEEGKIVDWNNEKAKNFVEYLKETGGEKALKAVELGLGTNPEHEVLKKNIIHDEKIIGSAHVAFGGWGEKRKCKIHEDVVLLEPTVFFNDEKAIEKGEII